MRFHNSFSGQCLQRRFKISATVIADQIVVLDQAADRDGEILDPSANDYTEMVGVTLEGATYTTTQGTGASSANREVKVLYDPFAIFKGNLSGGTTANTALAAALDGNILTNSTASTGGTLISDTNVGTSEYVGGLVYGLSGGNRNASRIISAHSDNVSSTVTVPFDYTLGVGDTFLRCMGPLELAQGEITGDWTQFVGAIGAGIDLPDTGHAFVIWIEVDASSPTAPTAEAFWMSADHWLSA